MAPAECILDQLNDNDGFTTPQPPMGYCPASDNPKARRPMHGANYDEGFDINLKI